MLDDLVASAIPFADYLDPVDWLTLLHVNKAMRRMAARKLKQHEANSPMLQAQRLMFQAWLQNPILNTTSASTTATGNGNGTSSNSNNMLTNEMSLETHWQHENPKEHLAGPLSLNVIQSSAKKLKKNFVILDYERSHLHESSTVVIFNDQGAVVAIYKIKIGHSYEAAGQQTTNSNNSMQVDDDDDDDDDPRLNMRRGRSDYGVSSLYFESSAGLVWESCNDPKKAAFDRFGTNWEKNEALWGGFEDDVVFCNYALFRQFQGQLSPTEAAFVLIHALSSNSRVIYCYTVAVFERLSYEMAHNWDDELHALFGSYYGDLWPYQLAGEAPPPALRGPTIPEILYDVAQDWKHQLAGIQY